VLLDSAFLIDLLDEDAGAVAKLDELEEEQTPVSIPALVVVEVGVGLSVVSEQHLFDDIIGSIPVLPFDRAAADRAVDIQRDLRGAGEEIGAVDVMIAGTAAASSDPTVLTRNVDEFDRVAAIDTETY
jgi:predicted nucleic acid-binding protein